MAKDWMTIEETRMYGKIGTDTLERFVADAAFKTRGKDAGILIEKTSFDVWSARQRNYQDPNGPRPAFDAKEAAWHLGKTPEEFALLARKGTIPHTTVNGRALFPRRNVEAYLAANPVPTPNETHVSVLEAAAILGFGRGTVEALIAEGLMALHTTPEGEPYLLRETVKTLDAGHGMAGFGERLAAQGALTPRQAADTLDVSLAVIQSLMQSGAVKVTRVCGTPFIRHRDIDALERDRRREYIAGAENKGREPIAARHK